MGRLKSSTLALAVVPLVVVALVASGPAPRVVHAEGDDPNHSDNGSPQNVVQLLNTTDNRLLVAGKVQLNSTDSTVVAPVNEAVAYSSCTGCQTLAVALQINLLESQVTTFTPQNVALAVNYQCSHCTTMADALQYNIDVSQGDNGSTGRAKHLVREMNAQLNRASHEGSLTAAQADVNVVITEFQDLASSLSIRHDEDERDTASGPKAAIPASSPAALPAAKSAAGNGAAPAPSASPAATASPSSTAAPAATASPSPGPSPSSSPAASPAAAASPSPTKP